MIKHNNSLADQVYEQLERDIILGNYTIGDVITETEFASKLGVSRTPVREALNRLEHENLVEETGKGTRIVGMSRKDILTIYKVRELIEGICAREAAENISDEALIEMKEILEYNEFCLERGMNAEKIRENDNRFHELLYKSSEDAVLYNILIPLHKKAGRFRQVNLSDQKRATKSTKEHREIYEALKSHDGDKAEAAAIKHVANAGKTVEKRKEGGKEQ